MKVPLHINFKFRNGKKKRIHQLTKAELFQALIDLSYYPETIMSCVGTDPDDFDCEEVETEINGWSVSEWKETLEERYNNAS